MNLKEKVSIKTLVCIGVVILFSQTSCANLKDQNIRTMEGVGTSTGAAVGAIASTGDERGLGLGGVLGTINTIIVSTNVSQTEFCVKYPPGTAGCPLAIELTSDKLSVGTSGLVIVGPAKKEALAKGAK
ncbi:MAG: hypothetical protein D3914_00350 [Candidatus Electrothrix sp. LOE2]|nr:hypothetical protein [Candidatus Electrothrix sp. LOE2]